MCKTKVCFSALNAFTIPLIPLRGNLGEILCAHGKVSEGRVKGGRYNLNGN